MEKTPLVIGSESDRSRPDWNSPVPQTGFQESMWQLKLSGREYPDRPGEPNCVYYVRTGSCGYGASCRFNHPLDRTTAAEVLRQGGEYPEREGQPVCQYFLKTGTCKFGASCKYHHPKHGIGPVNVVSFNYLGYPLRPGEKECAYYEKTGQCKFGVTCKFHHPQPMHTSVPTPAPTFYQTVQSPLAPPTQQFGRVTPSWQLSRPPLLTNTYMHGPYPPPVLFPPAMVHVSGWNTYTTPVTSVASVSTQPTIQEGPLYGVTTLSPSAPPFRGPYASVPFAAGPVSGLPKENTFPERPGQVECKFYMRTGYCKFGSACKYHHPSEAPNTQFFLNPMGLPLRPGAPPCTFYQYNGACSYGLTCKFDHPIGTLSYSPSASSLADVPIAPYPVGLSMTTLAPSSSSSDLRLEFITGSNKDSISTKVPSPDKTPSGSIGSIFSKSASAHSSSPK
ncbi:hypothetical protein GIB67_034550 [Kingdonia uniflora]|uniref:C3H1-type domain-containing protein n=1 Tax=Kingdonia uniflora TaxID=39325 RepID=A0A7J7PBW5_9MAGN|nr:hypothetical protein GIB67_034550 [Kingdonia uniflora]